jgi:16S rRNA (guanine527-N7)-methyltransferase
VALRDRLRDLGRRFELSTEVVGQLRTLLDALARPEAATSVHDVHRGVDIHVADSLVALDVPEVRAARTIADLGAGAGLPSLVLAAALPESRIVAVESVRKKGAFIAGTAEAMGLSNLEVAPVRAEEWREGIGICDLVTARALGALPVVCEYAAPLLRPGGVLVAWKGAVDAEEARDAAAAADVLGLAEPEVVPVEPFAGSERRTLYLFRKVGETPPKFPRRPGMAAKKPLRANTQRSVEGSDSRS